MIIGYKGKRYRLHVMRLIVLIVLVAGVIDLLFIGQTNVHDVPEGTYTCRGGLIQVCSTESNVVYKAYGR